jgi:hypothetical protein
MGGFFGKQANVPSSGFFGGASGGGFSGIWILRTLPASITNVQAVAGSATRIVILDGAGRTAWSDNQGATWTLGTGFSATNDGQTLCFNGSNLWVACCSNGVTLTSLDGKTWSVSGTIAPVFGTPTVTFGGGLFMIVTNSSAQNVDVYTSPDGVTWTGHGTTTPNRFSSLIYDGTDFVGGAHSAGGNAEISFSTNGAAWTSTVVAAFGIQDINRLAFQAGVYVATQNSSAAVIQQSPSATWVGTPVVQPLDADLSGVAFGQSVWCLTGDRTAGTFPQAATSTDLATWSLEDLKFGTIDYTNDNGVVAAGGTLVAWTISGKLSTRT